METEFSISMPRAEYKEKIEDDSIMGFWQEVLKDGYGTLDRCQLLLEYYILEQVIYRPGANLQNHELPASSLQTHFDEIGELFLGQMLEHVGSYEHN